MMDEQYNFKAQGVKIMGKGQDSKKAVKKEATKTPKEKKAEKKEKKGNK